MRYRLVALDLDGTLVDAQLRVDPRDVAAIRNAVERGVHVVACTGRPYPSALAWVERLDLHDPFVCYQGAQVRERDGRTLLDHGIERELAMEVVGVCRERDLEVHVYRDDMLLTERDRPQARKYAEHSGMEMHVVDDLATAMGETTPKVVSVSDAETVDRLLPEFAERWRERLTVSTSLPDYLEITSVAADKRLALDFLARRLGVPPEQAVAAGDGRNDLTMIEWAALGAAVEGAAPEVIAAADRVIAPPGSGAIAELLEEVLAERTQVRRS